MTYHWRILWASALMAAVAGCDTPLFDASATTRLETQDVVVEGRTLRVQPYVEGAPRRMVVWDPSAENLGPNQGGINWDARALVIAAATQFCENNGLTLPVPYPQYVRQNGIWYVRACK